MNPRQLLCISALFVIAVGINGCTKAKPVSKAGQSADIFADRPSHDDPEVFVVTLNSPALLTVSTKSNGHWTIPDDAKQAVLSEQAAFEAQLKKLAPDAQIVYRYRLVLNALAIYGNESTLNGLSGLAGVKNISRATPMERPEGEADGPSASVQADAVNSVNFIGADLVHKRGFTGRGLRIGILDTGIDYTHAMLGGSGNPADYKAIDPNQPNAAFPNAKVVGGIDLAGTDFNTSSETAARHLPKIDSNPLDEAGHGTHVAGTVAGVGDGKNSYDGVAPDAQLYAVKVFGKEGSTMDATVIAAFEYAANPKGDLNPDDQLDVVNLSLGGGFGQPQILYSEAVRNLSRAGTVVVAAAGNAGPNNYIVGAPSTAEEAVSIAASIDGAPRNWHFHAVRFTDSTRATSLAKVIEGDLSKPIADIDSVEGQLVDIGLADVDLSDDVKAQLKGKVALIQRGKNTFVEKIGRAVSAGAIGAVVYNNAPGQAIAMSTDKQKTRYDIPAIMISQDFGLKVKEQMNAGAVRIQFKTEDFVDQKDLIDTITEFSSKGPRSEDNLLKPEIAAPGQRIVSAAMAMGAGSVEMDGTSMATPHMTGALALVKQAHPDLSVAELKALVMDTSKILPNTPLTMQGAGRIQLDQAVSTPVVVQPASLSLGRMQVQGTRQESRVLKLKNLSAEALTLDTQAIATAGMTIQLPASIQIPAKGETEVTVNFTLSLENAKTFIAELDGQIILSRAGQIVAHIPALAIRTQAATVLADGPPEALKLKNASPVEGMALAFNLLGEDARKIEPKASESWKGRSCDLQSVGYRLLRKPTSPGVTTDVLQFAFKLYTPVTTWNMCQVDLLIDTDGDGLPEQELAGVSAAGVSGVAAAPFFSVLLDYHEARKIRLDYEQKVSQGQPDPGEDGPQIDYKAAILSGGVMAPFDQSTLSVIEIPLSDIGTGPDGLFHVKASSLGQGGDMIEPDDFLGANPLGDWLTLPSTFETQPYYGMDEIIGVTAAGANVTLTKGTGNGKLIMYYPMNQLGLPGQDNQSQIIEPR